MTESTAQKTGSTKREVVVMFSDIVSFTEYCDKHGEEAGVELVARHEDMVFPIIEGQGGTVVKTIGDAVMAYFEEAEGAGLAAQEIMRAVAADNEDRSKDEEMHLRAAFHMGPVIVRNNDLFGDTVNQASRMAGVGQPDQILISRSMIDILSDNPKFICRFVGKADFHGKTGTIELFEILTQKLELKEKKKSKIVSDSAVKEEETAGKGRLIGDKYFIERMIGEGGYGKVFKARHEETKDVVAIKMLPEDAYSFYSREAQVLRQLQPCPYIMSIIDAFVDEEGLCIVMPYIEHGSLQTYMNTLNGDPLQPGQTISLMEELLLGIAHAHSREVIHRDVKPQNILLAKGTDGILTDFGIAHAMESTGRTSTMTAGTSGYIAPEVTSGKFDASIDVYSAGVVLYKMLGGEFPVDLKTLPPYTDPNFVKIIARAIADRSKRYSSPEEMLEELRGMGSRVLESTMQIIAQSGEERILVAAEDAAWETLQTMLEANNITAMRCRLDELLKQVHWQVPSVTILDFTMLATSLSSVPEQVRACSALGTKVIVVNCGTITEAQDMLDAGAADCTASLEAPQSAEALSLAINTLMAQIQLGSGKSWWKKIIS